MGSLKSQESAPPESTRVPLVLKNNGSEFRDPDLKVDDKLQAVDWSEVDDAALIQLLTQKLQGQRQSAMLEVWRRRDTLREVVQRLNQGDDPEARARAIWILDQWGRGALPKTEAEVVRSLSQTPDRRSLRNLLDQGEFEAVVVALDESTDRLEGQSIRDRLAADLVKGFPIYAFSAFEQQQLKEFLRILDLVANTVELAVCRFGLMRELGVEITDKNLLPASAVWWTPLLRLQAECVLLFLKGEVKAAAGLAQQSIDRELLLRVQMVSGDWEEIATRLVVEARDEKVGLLERTRDWALVLAATERSLNARKSPEPIWELREEALRNLVDQDFGESVEGKLAAAISWKVLASHGEIDQALQILKQLSPSDAAGLCKESARINEAFGILGYPLAEADLDLGQWLSAALDQQRNWKLRELSPKVREMLMLMQCLITIGRNELALQIAEELSESDVLVGTLPMREFVVSTLSLTKRSDWMIALAASSDNEVVSAETYNTVSRSLSECDRFTLQTTVDAFREAAPSDSLVKHFKDAVSLFSGNQSSFEEREESYEEHFEILFAYLFTDPAVGMGIAAPRARKAERLNLDFVKLFQKHGQDRYAKICLEQLIERGDLEAMLMKAEQETASGNMAIAEQLFEQVSSLVSTMEPEGQRFGGEVDRHLGVRSQIGLWRIAKLRQNEVNASTRLQAIRYALCTPNLSARNELAEYLSEQDEIELAAENFEFLLPVVALGQRGKLSLYDVARRYSPMVKDQRPADAASWFDLALNQTLWRVEFRSGAYVSLPMFVHRWALEAEIKLGNENLANLRLDRMLKLDALDIDIAERLLPMMREHGMEADAERVLDHIIDLGLTHSERFPFDAMTSNNIAWIAAVNKQRLQDALQLSRVAVRAEPDSAIYRDTLAEVLFQLDRPEEALQIEAGCLIDDPTQWHLHQQYEKYRADLSSN